MGSKTRKSLLLAGKIVLAAALLAWVLAQVHWGDYVVDAETGESFTVLRTIQPEDAEPPTAFVVKTGHLWWVGQQRRPASDFQPVRQRTDEPGPALGYVRMGLASSLAQMNKAMLAPAMVGVILSLMVIAVRWRYLLGMQEIRLRYAESLRLTFLGQFFNAVVPGTIGGDLVKAWYASRHTSRKAGVLVSIIIDRAMGVTDLVLLAGVMTLVVLASGMKDLQELRTPLIAIAVLVVGLAGGMVFLLSASFRRALRLQKLYRRLPFSHYIAAAGDATGIYRRRWWGLINALALTVGAHVFWIGSIACLGIGLHLPTAWYLYFVYVPLVFIIGSVPLTPGGVGLVEQFFIVFFVSTGATPSEALALALLARLNRIFSGLPGIPVAVTGPKLPDKDRMKAEVGMS